MKFPQRVHLPAAFHSHVASVVLRTALRPAATHGSPLQFRASRSGLARVLGRRRMRSLPIQWFRLLARQLAGVFVAVALVALASAAAAQRPLTLADAQQLAVERSRQLVAQDAAVTASREMAVAAGQLPDPVATMGFNNVPVNGPDAWSLTRDFMTMTSIGVMQELTRSEKREARAQRFEREADKSQAERTVTIATIQRDTALAWLDRYYAEAQAGVVNEQIRQARLEIDAAETAFRAGRGNLSEILAGRSALASLEDRASELGRARSLPR
jgi:outer membrane protein TolC